MPVGGLFIRLEYTLEYHLQNKTKLVNQRVRNNGRDAQYIHYTLLFAAPINNYSILHDWKPNPRALYTNYRRSLYNTKMYLSPRNFFIRRHQRHQPSIPQVMSVNDKQPSTHRKKGLTEQGQTVRGELEHRRCGPQLLRSFPSLAATSIPCEPSPADRNKAAVREARRRGTKSGTFSLEGARSVRGLERRRREDSPAAFRFFG
jgi:hypothetical protein